MHRVGSLGLGDVAVWVGVSAAHRDEAFRACRFIIDEVKHRVPIWKKEHYVNGDSGWVNCERCAMPAAHERNAQCHTTHRTSTHARTTPRSHPRPTPDYSRQIALREVGAEGQARLRAASVLVVGAGGLGVPVLQYLAGAGVGRLGIVDADRLEPSNLHRQTWYALADCGQRKILARRRARARAESRGARGSACAAPRCPATPNGCAAGHDLILDCSDNFTTKFLLNDLALRTGKPVLFASVYQYEGQLQLVRGDDATACLRCVWPEATRDGLVGNCAEAGVLGPVPGVFGSLQALEALKLLLGLPGLKPDEMLIFDLVSLNTQRLRARRAAGLRGASARGQLRARRRHPMNSKCSSARSPKRASAGFTFVDVRDSRERDAEPLPVARAAPAHVQTTDRCRDARSRRALPADLRHRQTQRRGRRPAALAGISSNAARCAAASRA